MSEVQTIVDKELVMALHVEISGGEALVRELLDFHRVSTAALRHVVRPLLET